MLGCNGILLRCNISSTRQVSILSMNSVQHKHVCMHGVVADTPIVVQCQRKKTVSIIPIAHAAAVYKFTLDDKQFWECKYNVLTENGFVKGRLLCVQKATSWVVETQTSSGNVVTTDDAVLLRSTCTRVAPDDLALGAALLTVPDHVMYDAITTNMYTCEGDSAWLTGVLYACARIERGDNMEEMLVIRAIVRKETALRIKDTVAAHFKLFYCAYVPPASSTRNHNSKHARVYDEHVIRVFPNPRAALWREAAEETPVDWYRIRFTYEMHGERLKMIPECILNSPTSAQAEFVRGTRESGVVSLWRNVCKDNVFIERGGVAAQGMYMIISKLWNVVSIEREYEPVRKTTLYRIRVDDFREADNGRVLQIGQASCNPANVESMYSVVTSDRHYCAGVGNLVVHTAGLCAAILTDK